MTTAQDRRTEKEGDFFPPAWPLNAAWPWVAVQLKQFLLELPKACQFIFSSSTAMVPAVPGPKDAQRSPDPGPSAFQKD